MPDGCGSTRAAFGEALPASCPATPPPYKFLRFDEDNRRPDGLVTWRVSRRLSLSLSAGYFRNGAYSRASGFGNRQWLVQPYAIFQF